MALLFCNLRTLNFAVFFVTCLYHGGTLLGLRIVHDLTYKHLLYIGVCEIFTRFLLGPKVYVHLVPIWSCCILHHKKKKRKIALNCARHFGEVGESTLSCLCDVQSGAKLSLWTVSRLFFPVSTLLKSRNRKLRTGRNIFVNFWSIQQQHLICAGIWAMVAAFCYANAVKAR